MPKPIALTPALVDAPQITPQAATSARAGTATVEKQPTPKVDHMPLQVRLPRDQVKAIKIAAAEREQNISEFMLACFHAFMKNG